MSCGLHDAMQLEARGIPVVMLATDAFRRAADEQLAAIAFTAFSPVYVPHPVASLPADEVHRKADAAVAEIVARLTGSARSAAAPAPDTVRLDVPAVAESDGDAECDECAIDAAERGI